MELGRGIGTNQVSHSRAGILCLRPCLGLKGPHGLFLVEALKSKNEGASTVLFYIIR